MTSASNPENFTPPGISTGTGLGTTTVSTAPASTANERVKLTLVRQKQQVPFFLEPLNPDPGIQMIQIPAGSFLMGSPPEELERLDSEGPQRQVTLASFFMGKYPITQAQWKVVAALPPVSQELKPAPSHFPEDTRPVEQVSWYDAVEFCARLSTYTRREYRLPTEAEWEYACRASPLQTSGTPGSGEVQRAGTTTPFHFGETITTDLANYRGTDDESLNWSGSYGKGPKGEYRAETTPVDHFGIANAFGLCDMHGNVWEWCQDFWHNSYENAPTDGSAWLEGGDDSSRVLRGGSWYSNPRHCRSAYRSYNSPDDRNFSIGFRVVCSAPGTL